MNDVGVVAIGRNEGDRLRACLASVVGRVAAVVYVDSGSTDGSEATARRMGAEVVSLDPALPFAAARARNSGADRLRALCPGVRHVQFVDGDCEVVAGWVERARAELESSPELAVVCGRRRERHPERSPYNRLADIEWDTPVGEARACGGDAMIRVEAFDQVGGFDPTLIAGEEPDLCLRLRARGWKVARLDAEMTLHDMAMTRLGQWWRRSIRAGYAYAEGAARHGTGPERHWAREVRGIIAWGLALPIVAAALAWPSRGASLLLTLLYPLQFLRLSRRPGRGRDASLYALACIVGKFPQSIGLARYWSGRLLGRRVLLIEYKGDPPGRTRRPTGERRSPVNETAARGMPDRSAILSGGPSAPPVARGPREARP